MDKHGHTQWVSEHWESGLTEEVVVLFVCFSFVGDDHRLLCQDSGCTYERTYVQF